MFSVILSCSLVAIDGDTLRCGPERIRLLAIDAPEKPGHCRRGRRCAAGDPERSQRHLAAALRGRISIQRTGRDRFGRTLALVEIDGRDLSCLQLAGGMADYIARWDTRLLVAARCPELTVRHSR